MPAGWEWRNVVSQFDEKWRAAYARGEINFTLPTNRLDRHGPSSRVDGMVAEVANAATENVCELTEETLFVASAAGDLISIVANHGSDFAARDDFSLYIESLDEETLAAVIEHVKKEMVCFNCLGAGHRSNECPSPKRERKKEEHVLLIQALGAARKDRLACLGNPPRRRFNRPGFGRPSAPFVRPSPFAPKPAAGDGALAAHVAATALAAQATATAAVARPEHAHEHNLSATDAGGAAANDEPDDGLFETFDTYGPERNPFPIPLA